MAVTYKDIDELTQKSSLAGNEKIPVSDTDYTTPDQIAVRKRVYLEYEDDMPSSPDPDTLYLIEDINDPMIYKHLSDESELPAEPDDNTLYLIDAEGEVQTSMPQGGFAPNKLYNLGTLTGSVTFTLAAPRSQTVVNHYYWTFDTGATVPSITWPSEIVGWNGGDEPTIAANKHYEISVLGGYSAYMEV